MRRLAEHTALLLTCVALPTLMGGAPAGGDDAGSFQPVGSMAQARDGAQATLLADGTVLVTGGDSFDIDVLNPLDTAELFDPKTNQFTAVGSMPHVHGSGHRAVRLQDGRVLVVGGGFSPGTADVYDPATGRFSAAGSMSQERGALTATLLTDGRVLVAGGWVPYPDYSASPTVTALLFDPTSGKFQVTGAMTTPRATHAAVALPDGRVVLLGGYDGSKALASVEIYDPRSSAFSAQGSLVEARADLRADLLPDGRILVVGGGQAVEVYDPSTGHSLIMGALTDARTAFALAPLPGGQLLVAGGEGTAGPLRSVEIVDPMAGKIFPTRPMTTERSQPAGATLPDGRVLILGGLHGGFQSTFSLSSAEIYVPAGTALPSRP